MVISFWQAMLIFAVIFGVFYLIAKLAGMGGGGSNVAKLDLSDYSPSSTPAPPPIKRKGCAVCGGSIQNAEGGKIMMTSGDFTLSSSSYGRSCNACNALVHFRCCKIETLRESGLTITKGYCPQCGNGLLTMMKD